MKTNLLTTIGGIMSGLLLIPPALGTAHVHMPNWLYVFCIFAGTLGPVVIGVAAKGQDTHSTPDQVQQAGDKENAQAAQQANAQNAAGPKP